MSLLRMDRRLFLAAAGAVGLARWPVQAAEPATYSGLIIRQRDPDNLEMPFASLSSFLTPNESFFVRSHFRVPAVDRATWKLRVEGAVERPLDLSFDELLKLPARTAAATLECAGNGRIFLNPRVTGLQWEQGAVGTAEWTGIPLAAILERAGVRSPAVEVVLEGADSGEVRDPQSPGIIHFARSLPIDKARRPEVLLAHRMNGAELSTAHGFPVRAVVPGWYGVASVKWLTRILVTDRPFHGFYQSLDYTIWQRVNSVPTIVPVTELEVKAQIARPAMFEAVKAGSEYRVHGAAWTGESEVVRVEVSTDAGKHWEDAKLAVQKPVPFTWRFWDYTWRVPAKPGRHALQVRATDKRGRTQPPVRDIDRRTYLISHSVPIEVEAR